jgi:hypothetical protein
LNTTLDKRFCNNKEEKEEKEKDLLKYAGKCIFIITEAVYSSLLQFLIVEKTVFDYWKSS